MRARFRIIGAALAVGLVVAGAALPLAAQATTKYLALPPNALKPANWDADQKMWTSSQTGFNYSTSVNMPLDANAPIYLPEGAVIKKVTFYFTDNNAVSTGKMDFSLNRQKLSTGSLGAIATANTGASATSASRKSIDAAKIVNGKVDNLNYTYSLNVRFNAPTPLLQFHGAVVWYE
jgi:hypothetical protein